MNSYILLSVKVSGNVIEALDKAGDLAIQITELNDCEVTVLNTIPAPE